VTRAVFVVLGVMDTIGVVLVILLWRLCLAIGVLNDQSREVVRELNGYTNEALAALAALERAARK
jgi:predicted PurR-regulated permease PerM